MDRLRQVVATLVSASRNPDVRRVELAWGAAADGVARQVQERVAEYIERMANLHVGSVDVVVERVGAPPAKQ